MRTRFLCDCYRRASVAGFFLALLMVGSAAQADGQDTPTLAAEDFAFIRTLRGAMQKRSWRNASGLADRLATWRSEVNAYKPGQDPISERYVVTAYGGVIDLRHFLYTASKVLSAQGNGTYWRGLDRPIDPRYSDRRYRNPLGHSFRGLEFHIQLALYDSYCVERGREYVIAQEVEKPDVLQALIDGQYWQCTPEDLPSSALGAEFARGLIGVRDELTVDIEEAVCKFLAPFKPVPDNLRQQISHSEAVFGVVHGSSEKFSPEKLIHFSAVPVVFTKLLNKKAAELKMGKFCDDVADGKAGLAKAGYQVADIAGSLPLKIMPLDK